MRFLCPAQLVASPMSHQPAPLAQQEAHVANSTARRGRETLSSDPILLVLETGTILFPPKYFLQVYTVSSELGTPHNTSEALL